MINKIMRVAKNPLGVFGKYWQQYNDALKFTPAEKEYWDRLRNAHVGRQGFVVCNGPSLAMGDLDKIRNQITIASNKIYLAFEKTLWRPTYYTTADVLLWEKIKDVVGEYFDNIHIPTCLDKGHLGSAVYWKSKLMGPFRRFSDDMSKCAYSGHTITFQNLQFAVHLGLNPIYLIGCDHNYPGEKNIVPGKPIIQSNNNSHFIKNYRQPGEVVLPASIVDMEISYSEARKYADKHNIKIYNATRGGHLEIFERFDFDKISLDF